MTELISAALRWLQEWGRVLSGIGSVIVSIVLGFLYYFQVKVNRRQTDLLEKQGKVMENQEELMELEYAPRIWPHSFDIHSGEGTEGENDSPTLSVELENLGNGLAENIHALTYMELTEESDALDQAKPVDDINWGADEPLELLDSYLASLQRVDEEAHLTKWRVGGVLSPDEGPTLFEGNIQVQVQKQDTSSTLNAPHPHWLGDSDLFDILSNTGYEEVAITVYIVYSDINDGIHINELTSSSVEIMEGEEFKMADILDGIGGHSKASEGIKEKVRENFSYPPSK